MKNSQIYLSMHDKTDKNNFVEKVWPVNLALFISHKIVQFLLP